MAPGIGEVISVASETSELKRAIVVGHDTAGTPEIIPVEAADSLQNLERYVGPAKARELAQRGLLAVELGV